MTTTAAPEIQARVLALLMEAPEARRAQFASHVRAAEQGTLCQLYAVGILRQLRSMESPAEGEDKIRMPRSNGSNATSSRSSDASEAQAKFAATILRTRVQADERVPGTVKTAGQVLAQYEADGRMSKTVARAIIDSWKDRPRQDAEGQEPSATPGQVRCINSMLAERDQEPMSDELAAQLTPAAASAMITALKATPRPAKPAKAEPVELLDGIYRLGDDWFKIVHAVHGSGKQYAKKIAVSQNEAGEPVAEWVYEGTGPLRKLTPEHRVGLEEARQFGELYGVCLKCGATLTDEESISDNIGPYCSGKKGSAAQREAALAYWA